LGRYHARAAQGRKKKVGRLKQVKKRRWLRIESMFRKKDSLNLSHQEKTTTTEKE